MSSSASESISYLIEFIRKNRPQLKSVEKHLSGWVLEDFKNYSVIDRAIIKRIRKSEELLVVYLRK